MGKLIGQSIKRVEDERFITGDGEYTDDIKLLNMTHASIVRSPHAHANIKGIDVSKAKSAPGVVGIFTGKDFADAGIAGVPCGWQVNFKNGDTMKEPPHPILAVDKARHVGDGVAVVIAETLAQAKDAAELVEVDYEVLDAVTLGSKAIADGAPQLFDDVPNNTFFDWELGDKEKTDTAMAGAAHITKLNIVNQRLIPNAIEPRSAIGDYNSSRDQYTLYTATQNPHLIRLLMCAFVLSIPEHKVRVVARDVGGGFGSKVDHYVEEVIVTWCSKQLKRPIKWTADRTESFVTDVQGRDHETVAEMGFDSDNNIVGLRVKTIANIGAYLGTFGPGICTWFHGPLFQGCYTTPAIHVDVTAAASNTVTVDALRGAGRPETTYILERLMETAASELNVDPAELRSQNFIPAFDGVEQEGYVTQVALQYDSGDYQSAMKKALELCNYKQLREEQKEARTQGRYIGIGFSSFTEACGAAPSAVAGALGARAGLYESGEVRVEPTGKISVFTGSHSHGQGHETAFAQIVADYLGVAMEDVKIHHGDTDTVQFGMGTYGSRSLAVGGTAIVKSLEKVIEKGAIIAAHLLEASAEDLEFAEGKWTVKGTEKSIGFGDVALTAYVPHNYPEGLEPGLDFTSFFDPVNFVYPFGTYIAVVEVDVETGKVDMKKFYGCDDVGNVINPMIVEGQIHGGVAHGIGQALLEQGVYDESGQLLTGSFLDYTMPRADDIPSFELTETVTPSPVNPLGVKGVGEVGAIGTPPAVVNAVIDALSPLGVKDLEMPLTPQKVWQAIQQSSNN